MAVKSFYDDLNSILCNGQNQNLLFISRIDFIGIIFLLHSVNKNDVIIVTCWIYECILLYDSETKFFGMMLLFICNNVAIVEIHFGGTFLSNTTFNYLR